MSSLSAVTIGSLARWPMYCRSSFGGSDSVPAGMTMSALGSPFSTNVAAPAKWVPEIEAAAHAENHRAAVFTDPKRLAQQVSDFRSVFGKFIGGCRDTISPGERRASSRAELDLKSGLIGATRELCNGLNAGRGRLLPAAERGANVWRRHEPAPSGRST